MGVDNVQYEISIIGISLKVGIKAQVWSNITLVDMSVESELSGWM